MANIRNSPPTPGSTDDMKLRLNRAETRQRELENQLRQKNEVIEKMGSLAVQIQREHSSQTAAYQCQISRLSRLIWHSN